MLTIVGIALLGVGAFCLGVWSVFAYLNLFSTLWVDDEAQRAGDYGDPIK